MAILITIILCIILLAITLLIFKRFYKNKYERQKEHNLNDLRNELIDLGYNQDDIENRVDYADQNYVSDNAGNIDEMLYKLVTSDSFYENEENHYTNQNS